MNIKPLFTEKTLNEAKNGKYTFIVGPFMNKMQIKKAISNAFGVHVKSVRTMAKAATSRKNMYGKIVTTKRAKKAIVTLAAKEKIDIFEQISKENK